MPPFSFYIRKDDKEVEFNISQLVLEQEFGSEWDTAKREAYQSGTIVYDPDGVIAQLIAFKTVSTPKTRLRSVVTNLNQYVWRAKIHSVTMFHRGVPETAHALIHEGVDLLVQSLFILNGVEPPHTKWRLLRAQRLPYVPASFKESVRKATLVKSMKLKDIERRIAALEPLLQDLMTHAAKTFETFPQDLYQYWSVHLSGRQLLRTTFADTLVHEHQAEFSKQELKLLHGFASYHLCSDYAALRISLYADDALQLLPAKLITKTKSILFP